jgi:hypothetical protein
MINEFPDSFPPYRHKIYNSRLDNLKQLYKRDINHTIFDLLKCYKPWQDWINESKPEIIEKSVWIPQMVHEFPNRFPPKSNPQYKYRLSDLKKLYKRDVNHPVFDLLQGYKPWQDWINVDKQ